MPASAEVLERPPRADWEEGGFALYLHWPFCQAKCPYCDFNSHVAAAIDQPRWARAYVAEIARAATETPGRPLASIFLGGGTPSLMVPETVAEVLAAARAAWPAANDLEVTLEANPSSVEAGRFAAYAEAGVNRVSLGVQALNDTDLRALGRLHDAAQARTALEIARHSFGRVSFDLIYARQGQTREAWQAELGEALAMAPDHLSLYQLTIEPGTPFAARHERGLLRGLPDEDVAADLFLDTAALCEAAGRPAYEVSNHARQGAESRHNLVYWRSGEWVGIGPGAHGRLTLDGRRVATAALREPAAWLGAVERASWQESRETLTCEERADELLVMGLRLTEGVPLARYAALADAAALRARASPLAEEGLLEVDENRMRLTARGRPLLDAILRALA